MSGTATTKPCLMPLEDIRLNGGTQMRAQIDLDTIKDYADVIDELPPIVVFDDGKAHWLADGFHRFKAAQFAGREAIACDIHKGSRRDAILFAAQANAKHGLRRSNADKRKAVLALVCDREWSKWSNTEIARRCCVDESMVRRWRRELQGLPPEDNGRCSENAEQMAERLADHRIKLSPSSNGHREQANGKAKRIRCPFCKKQFTPAASHLAK